MLKNKLQQIIKEFTELKKKIHQKLELAKQENTENEKLLEQLLKEFQDLSKELE